MSWAAIQNANVADVVRVLDVKRTGRFAKLGERSLMGRELPNGWYVLVADSCDDAIVQSKILKQLSKKTNVLACSAEEHVMFSSCAWWKNGRKSWSLQHKSERGRLDLEKTGNLPESFERMREAALENQRAEGGEDADVDHVFEVPLQLAEEQVGFGYDDSDEAEYEILTVGLAKRLWRASLLWRLGAAFVLGCVAFFYVMKVVAMLAFWLIKRFS